MKTTWNKRRSTKGKYVICFFCLKRTSEYHIVVYNAKELGMKFKVYACDECYKKLKIKGES